MRAASWTSSTISAVAARQQRRPQSPVIIIGRFVQPAVSSPVGTSLFSSSRRLLSVSSAVKSIGRDCSIVTTNHGIYRRSSPLLSLINRQRTTACARRYLQRRSATTTTTKPPPPPSWYKKAWKEVSSRPVEFVSIPCVAAFVGIMTNWMGVKMLFYPIEYFGLDLHRWPNTPYGLFGWCGVVPTKCEVMAKRLVKIVTERLLSLDEAFSRLDPAKLAKMMLPGIQESIDKSCEPALSWVLRPFLPLLLPYLVSALQREIDSVLDLDKVVLDAFVRDKSVLVDLFQKVGRVELTFLVNSGFGFGFILGLGQMVAWAAHPAAWTLPAAGAVVGYITNWIAIKMIFEPAEPVNLGVVEIQGLFEARQIEVSDEFGDFMQKRVLTAQQLLNDMASGGDDGDLYKFLRRHLPYPIPHQILSAAVAGVTEMANNPLKYPEIHAYVNQRLDIRDTLARRLKTLTPLEFEDLLHPVFQEDEITLIATGGVLGLGAGMLQTQLGWGGPFAVRRAIGTILFTLASSLAFYAQQEYESELDEPLASKQRPHLRRRETIVRPKVEDPFGIIPPPIPEYR